jgi:hypothetical protein
VRAHSPEVAREMSGLVLIYGPVSNQVASRTCFLKAGHNSICRGGGHKEKSRPLQHRRWSQVRNEHYPIRADANPGAELTAGVGGRSRRKAAAVFIFRFRF